MTDLIQAERSRMLRRRWQEQQVAQSGLKFCECGCGQTIPRRKLNGQSRKLVNGHRLLKYRVGDTQLNAGGYVKEYAPGHPEAHEGWVLQHRLVWSYVNGPIPDGMVIHHRNEDRTDNWPENLEAKSNGIHTADHARERWRDAESQCANLGKWVTATRIPQIAGFHAGELHISAVETSLRAANSRANGQVRGISWLSDNSEGGDETSGGSDSRDPVEGKPPIGVENDDGPPKSPDVGGVPSRRRIETRCSRRPNFLSAGFTSSGSCGFSDFGFRSWRRSFRSAGWFWALSSHGMRTS